MGFFEKMFGGEGKEGLTPEEKDEAKKDIAVDNFLAKTDKKIDAVELSEAKAQLKSLMEEIKGDVAAEELIIKLEKPENAEKLKMLMAESGKDAEAEAIVHELETKTGKDFVSKFMAGDFDMEKAA